MSQRHVLRLPTAIVAAPRQPRSRPLWLSFWEEAGRLARGAGFGFRFRSFARSHEERAGDDEVFAEAPERGLEAYLRTLGRPRDD